jgi:hypothetical protein
MKILIIYTPRSGTNSIANYFLKQNKHYQYFNQPFSLYGKEGITPTTYDECISYDNVLVKNEIRSFHKLNITKEKILNDFDKVLLISRKNKKEQSISYLIAENSNNFLGKDKRVYYVESIDDEILEEKIKTSVKLQIILEQYISDEIPLFYYEDLYYDDFSKLLQYLNIQYIDEDFKNILDIKNKYKVKELYIKKQNTLI